MSNSPRITDESAASELLQSLAALPMPPTLLVAEVEGRIACLILVWDSAQLMPTIGAERKRRVAGGRTGCRADVMEMVRSAGRALTRKEVVKALKLAGKKHGPGTVAKALADLTSLGELVNLKDKKGYRLPEWKRRQRTGSLFD